MSVTIISSVYGGYDTISAPIEQTIPCEWVMVTDGESDIPAGWHQIIEPRRHMHPRLAAKVAKCRPDWYTDADISIWVDASFDFTRNTFAQWCVDQLGTGSIAQIVHPERESITDEADVSRLMEKYQGQPVVEQARHYVKEGHPDRWGLWATGLMVRRPRVTAEFGERWLAEQIRWTYQDQISEPTILREAGLRPEPVEGPLWSHPMFSMHRHRSDL